MTSPALEQLQDARNVLMLASSLSPASGDIHHDLFGERTLAESNVLVLTFGRADRWLRELRAEHGDPNETAIIQIDETLRRSTSHPDDVTVKTVSPTDLTGVGMAVSDVIERWTDGDAETVVCFDSVTDFLQYADSSTMYRFLRVVTRRFDAVDGFAHFHMNPNAHDQQTIATLKSPFDAVVDASDGSDVSVSTRY
ncbi:hypothetical protein M0R89_18190 [Halorussus limi]|uniref:RecA-superfamily ATPase, KaiC/GvpD/RAD55 family n=1 Tax=Halorussus limi TaxID=2938695 RepID=A0A8U0HU62_9EURY|nr:hypothetical protein [Halorussus limi]UPV74447.1 hypothetical protein M0R89_18190 [Halorussus limi]